MGESVSSQRPGLLSVVELGGYPDFSPLYKAKGFDPDTVVSVRKALAALKKRRPDVVVAEFNFQSDFRDRTSSLESLLAVTQSLSGIHIIVFYEKEFEHQLDKLTSRFQILDTIAFPVNEERLARTLERVVSRDLVLGHSADA